MLPIRDNDVTLTALKRDRKRLQGIHTRAKNKSEAYLTAGTDLINIHKELCELHNRLKHNPAEFLKELDKLDAKRKRLKRLLSCDGMKLFDKEIDAQLNLDDINRAIQYHEFYSSRRRKAN